MVILRSAWTMFYFFLSWSAFTFGVFPSVASRVRSRSWEGGAMKITYGLRLENLRTRSDWQKKKYQGTKKQNEWKEQHKEKKTD